MRYIVYVVVAACLGGACVDSLGSMHSQRCRPIGWHRVLGRGETAHSPPQPAQAVYMREGKRCWEYGFETFISWYIIHLYQMELHVLQSTVLILCLPCYVLKIWCTFSFSLSVWWVLSHLLPPAGCICLSHFTVLIQCFRCFLALCVNSKLPESSM